PRRPRRWPRRRQADHPLLVPQQGRPPRGRHRPQRRRAGRRPAVRPRPRRGGVGPGRGGGPIGVPPRRPPAGAVGAGAGGVPVGAAAGHPDDRRPPAAGGAGLPVPAGRDGRRADAATRPPPVAAGHLLHRRRDGHRGRGGAGAGGGAHRPVVGAPPGRRPGAAPLGVDDQLTPGPGRPGGRTGPYFLVGFGGVFGVNRLLAAGTERPVGLGGGSPLRARRLALDVLPALPLGAGPRAGGV